ncbi:MAG: glutathione-disulfide reductase [Devosiaceae bacterium]|nr:glutathione-disulfide reductase [Devosiaceae bacterium]
MANSYDLLVIGGGSGGVRAARVAAGFGAKVCIVEEYRLGGTCVIRGCVPKKLFSYASGFSTLFDIAPSFGWSVEASFDWSTLLANKDKEIARLEKLYGSLLGGSGVEIVADRAQITSPNSVTLSSSGKVLTADKILIATGGKPFVPSIPGIEHSITSNEAFDLKTLPKSIVIVGGGYIAVEFAAIFNGLGVETILAYRGAQILRGFDSHIREGLAEEMVHNGIKVCLATQPATIEKTENGLCVTCTDEMQMDVDQVMYATGRVPNVEGLGLENIDVTLGKHGEIPVDEFSRTTCPSVFAVGDVNGRAALTPVAIREGAAFAQTEFNDNPTRVDLSIVASAVFSNPEIGTLGLSENEATEKFSELNVYVARFKPMIYSFVQTDTRMLMKLITDAKTDKVLGVHIMGAGAGEMIQMVGIAVTMGATKADFDRTIAVHPVAAEELVTMKEPTYKIVDGERV